jgi:hypothetical protein
MYVKEELSWGTLNGGSTFFNKCLFLAFVNGDSGTERLSVVYSLLWRMAVG